MRLEIVKSIIESILFAAGRVVKNTEFATILEMTPAEVDEIMQNYMKDFQKEDRGIEIIKVDNGYQLATKKKNFEYLVQVFDNRVKPSLSSAALETLAIIAYNPKITRAEIEAIRGVKSDGTIYRLLDYNLIEDAGKSDAPGKPSTYRTTQDFLKMFGISNLDELPELPRYKLDENEQIVLDDINSASNDKIENNNSKKRENDTTFDSIMEAPSPVKGEEN